MAALEDSLEADLAVAAAENPGKAVRPTKKQQELLVFIQQFIAEHGYSPSYREIMNGCQYTSVATVALHVGNLIKRGHLRKRDHSARSIEVVDAALPESGGTPVASATAAKTPDNNWLYQQTRDFIKRLEANVPAANSSETDFANAETLLRACAILKLPTHGLEDRLAALRLQSYTA